MRATKRRHTAMNARARNVATSPIVLGPWSSRARSARTEGGILFTAFGSMMLLNEHPVTLRVVASTSLKRETEKEW